MKDLVITLFTCSFDFSFFVLSVSDSASDARCDTDGLFLRDCAKQLERGGCYLFFFLL